MRPTIPRSLNGWGKRGYNWEFSTGVQHELLPRMSVDVSYFRRWYGNFLVTDNLAVAPPTSTSSSSPRRRFPRLPDGGGIRRQRLFNLNPAKFGLPSDNYVTRSPTTTATQIEHWHGVDVNVSAAAARGSCCRAASAPGAR